MTNDAFELGESINNHTNSFRMYPPLWQTFNSVGVSLKSSLWKEVKYLNKKGDDFSKGVKNLPNDKGGIYMYIIKSPVLPGITNYLVYIGRAQLTDHHSLRIRCKKYLSEYSRDAQRPKITKMIRYYKEFLYLRYIIIDDNAKIQALEKTLINSLLPPFNDEIPDKEERDAVKAFLH